MNSVETLDEAISTLVRALIIQERQLCNDVAGLPRNPLDLEILSFLDRYPAVQAKDIATYLQISATTLQSALDRLERRVLLTRDRKSLKGRSVAISLTPEGRKARNLMQNQNIDNCKAMLRVIDPMDRERFVNNMVKIATRFSRAG
jgi:DNA-binding MarR family transcriptional regulator